MAQAIKRHNLTIPFGYKPDPANEKLLIPVEQELAALREAKKFREQGYPWRSLRDWVVNATGRKITHMGLKKILEKRTDFNV